MLSTLAGLAPLLAEDKPATIRIGVAATGSGSRLFSGGGYGPIAAEWGSLEKEFARDGVKFSIKYFQGAGPSVNESLASKQLDFAFMGDLPALIARAGGLPTKAIMASGRFGTILIVVPADSSIRRFEELKGKRIAVFKGTASQLAFWNLLNSKGFKDSDFRTINMSTFEGNSALLSKDVDAQVASLEVIPLVQTGKVRIIYTTHADRRLGSLGQLLTTEEFAAKYPSYVQRVVNTYLKAAAWVALEKNRPQAYAIWARSGLPVAAWKYEYDDQSLGERNSPRFDLYYRTHYKRLLKLCRDQKLVRKDFDVDAWLDGSYVERGIQTLNLQKVWRNQDQEGRPH